ncbi:aggregation-promoting factor C-terminal-like domain-containing protein [Secundilactobacillus malefermentans]|uniref:aggregation-promoting factor C-terminal-like domain-containing protein n=1 Tax=Secundilactobacillus malefermentans TaxID=176292 RepID=UPI0011C9069F|nr:transglycosylase [Secundilactobacillus malefermentans]QEA31878.1 transglycosylase [Secundilactobacillus malefermentans]
MSKLRNGFIVLLAVFGFAFGSLSSVSTEAQPVRTAEAATTAQQITKINSTLSAKNKAAKKWIAMRESGGSYTAKNGNCYGRYQLLRSYLHYNYTKVNQEKTANKYVAGRYGSWTKAKSFWLSHHWY